MQVESRVDPLDDELDPTACVAEVEVVEQLLLRGLVCVLAQQAAAFRPVAGDAAL